MKVINNVNLNTENKELLPQILNRIYAICKKDSSFHLKDELQSSEIKSETLQKKINKKTTLLEQSQIILEDLQKRNNKLKNNNDELRATLLESLGSEL